MGVDVKEQREQQDAEVTQDANGTVDRAKNRPVNETGEPVRGPGRVAQVVTYVRDGFKQLRWGLVLALALAAGVLMPLSVAQSGPLSLFAGIVPVGAGLIIGRRVPGYYALHGFMTGAIAALLSLGIISYLIFQTPLGPAFQQALATTNPATGAAGPIPTLGDVAVQLTSFVPFSLLTFCTFGAVMSGRTESRNRLMREEIATRGGRLEKPSTIRSLEDVQGLSLPQFGSYVNNVFKKNGFQFKDYRFVDKDKHLDLWMEYEEEVWHIRTAVQDKIGPGAVEGLMQEMRREGVHKGVVVTSTEFTPSARKSGKGRAIILIDGATLYEIAEK